MTEYALLTPGCNHSLDCHPPSALRPGGMTPATCDGRDANFESLSLIFTIPQWPSISRFHVGRTPEFSMSFSSSRDRILVWPTDCERSNSSQACYDCPPHCVLHWLKLNRIYVCKSRMLQQRCICTDQLCMFCTLLHKFSSCWNDMQLPLLIVYF